MPQSPRLQWPMPEYLSAWKLFRDNSDENEVTAKFLVNRPSWPRREKLDICDLGCGDGKLVAQVLNQCDAIHKLRLVDPDQGLLLEAEALIENDFPGKHIIASLTSVREGWPLCAGSSDIVLGVHLVYLLEEDELHSLIHQRPRNAVTYVVLDAPTSVFTELWQWTADKYFRRAKLAHTELCKFLNLSEPPKEATVRSRIPKKLLSGHKLSDWLLSILCYRNMLTDVPEELRSKVSEIIDLHTDETGEFVECRSVCYELPPQL